MSWRSVLANPGAWERLSAAEMAAWVDDELDGRGLLSPRDDAEPADLLRDAAQKGGGTVRLRIEEALVATFCRRFDAADTGECSADERLALAFAARAIEIVPVSRERAPVERLERGAFAEWASAIVEKHAAPHPLRQTFARPWLAVAAPSGPTLSRLLADPVLVNLGFGTLYGELWRAMEYLPVAVRTLHAVGRDKDLQVHLTVLRDRHGGAPLLDAIGEARLTRAERDVVNAGLVRVDLVPPAPKVTALDASFLGADSTSLPKRISG